MVPLLAFPEASTAPRHLTNQRWSFFFWLFFWPCHAACRILVPRPGIESVPPAVEAWSPNHWTARGFSKDGHGEPRSLEVLLFSPPHCPRHPHSYRCLVFFPGSGWAARGLSGIAQPSLLPSLCSSPPALACPLSNPSRPEQ